MCRKLFGICSKQSFSVFQTHHDQVQAECLRRVPVPNPVTGRWKRQRPEHAEGSARPDKDPFGGEDHLPQTSKKRATSATAIPAETNPSRGILDELAERLGNFHDSARALASCLQNHDVSRKTDQSIIEAAKCTFHKLLGEASDYPECVTSRESLCAETTWNKRRCSRSETPSEKPCSRSETLTEKPRSRSETPSEKPRSRPETPSEKSVWQTSTDGTPMPVPIPPSLPDHSGVRPEKLESVSKTQPSSESLQQVVEGDLRRHLELSVPQHAPGGWKDEFKMSSFTATKLNVLFTEAKKGKSRHFRVYIGPGSDGSSADKLSLDLKFNPWDTAITFRPEWRPMSKTVFTQYDPSKPWYTAMSKRFMLCDRCSSVLACSGGHRFC